MMPNTSTVASTEIRMRSRFMGPFPEATMTAGSSNGTPRVPTSGRVSTKIKQAWKGQFAPRGSGVLPGPEDGESGKNRAMLAAYPSGLRLDVRASMRVGQIAKRISDPVQPSHGEPRSHRQPRRPTAPARIA